MAYDEALASRVRAYLAGQPGLSEQRMFGGLAFLVNGHMAVSASSQGGLLLRVEPALTEALVQHSHAQRFVMHGREMDGWLRIDGRGVASEEGLERWVTHGLTYARSLHPT